jgi:hypothetical protein
MRVPEESVCIDLFRQNQVFTSLHLKFPDHVVPPQAEVRAELSASKGDHDAAVTNPASEGQNMREQQCSQLADSSSA